MIETPIAQMAEGRLEGFWLDGVATFRNVRYATAPTGEHRFSPPEPAASWSGSRDARHHGRIAPQPPSRLRAAVGDYVRPQGEDCLSLTIWTPAPGRSQVRPVLVWLHGGAYMSGAGSLDCYDGATLAREGGIVVVGVNYRLGACGFLHHPDVNPPNAAIQDQIMALGWVAEYIAEFGGDPGAVTVMGQSAGGGSIAFLLTQPTARHLFQRVILQSAALYPPLSVAQASARACRVAEFLGIDPSKPDMSVLLRAAPIAALIEAQVKVAREVATVDPLALPFCPIGDGATMTAQDYTEQIAEGADGKAMMIGWTRNEMHAFYAADPAMQNLDEATLAARSSALAGDATAIDAYRAPGASAMDVLADFVTDYRFARPAQRLADAIVEHGGKVWTYRFDWTAPGSIFKACHCIELPFLFNTIDTEGGAPMLTGGDRAEMDRLAVALRRAWINFASGDAPGHADLPAWPTRRSDRAGTLCFDRVCHVLT